VDKIVQASTGIPIGKTFGSPFGQEKGLADLVSVIVSSAFAIASVILLFFFIFGGISMIAGAGQDNPEKAAKGKQAVTSAAIGFIIIFAAYWIVRLIEVIIGVNFITAPGI
jgi:hypothetical protein